ncbi:SH3 domain-containing protein [Pigmentibacter ruber]|uniref:SH3 domain-containing protein n=1 Tax=Pigmentibacter ruber TaxID=2683196 RepID=UPI00131E6626|nr:SH3 domain-containing protein [Pigmentibacter ruber]
MEKTFLSIVKRTFIIYVFCIISYPSLAFNPEQIQIFPINKYNQDINHFFDQNSSEFNVPIFHNSIIENKVSDFKERFMGSQSPWSENYVSQFLKTNPPEELLKNNFRKFRENCDTTNPKSFSSNFRPYSCSWFDHTISKNSNFQQFTNPHYNSKYRAIAINNSEAKLFPTYDPLYFNYKIAGNGYPFDQLQDSSIWIGSPLYVIGMSQNGWSLVITHTNIMTWVPSQNIAFVSDKFIKNYITYANTNGFRSIIRTEANITVDDQNFKNLNTVAGYIGSIFPGKNKSENTVWIPHKLKDGTARLVSAEVKNEGSTFFPLSPTPAHFSKIIKELNGRTYGWGGMYFNNDCSQEMQSIFSVFGIWLPRNSVDQYKTGKIIDLSSQNTEQRIQSLIDLGRKLVTLVYIPGHIMLYVGNINGTPWIYNNIWALRPADNSYRSVIGQSLFLPVLKEYTIENSILISLADDKKRSKFILTYLDEML